jgi:flagellar hook-length control protein FliK
LPRATPARDGAPQLNASPFQDALALELGLALDTPILPGLGVPAIAAKAGSSVDPGEGKAQTAIAVDAPLGLAGLPLFPLASLLPPAAPATAPFAPVGTASFAPIGTGSFAPTGKALFAPTGTEGAAPAPDLRKNPLARTSATSMAGTESPIAAVAADFAAHGKFPSSADGELRREAAFDISLLEQAAPAPAAALHTGGTAPTQVAHASVAALETRVGERGWDQGLGDKLVWMAGHKLQVAELHLNPPDLGPLKITLTLDNDQASAQFVSAHASVREALEAAMPRLREMLADSGITLGNASVSTDAFREPAQSQHQPRTYPAAPAAADPGALARGERPLRRSHGLVDTFA